MLYLFTNKLNKLPLVSFLLEKDIPYSYVCVFTECTTELDICGKRHSKRIEREKRNTTEKKAHFYFGQMNMSIIVKEISRKLEKQN